MTAICICLCVTIVILEVISFVREKDLLDRLKAKNEAEYLRGKGSEKSTAHDTRIDKLNRWRGKEDN